MSTGSTDRPPSMMDVAAAAGVSHQTVSRVLNGSDKVSTKTRDRVHKAIKDLGYRRNSVARALVTRKSGIIGIITTTSVHHGPTSILLAIELAAREAGYFTGVAPLDVSTPESLRSAVDHFLGLAVEAVVIVAPLVEMAEDIDLVDIPVPVVAVRSPAIAQAAGVLSVSVDQENGARQAVRHLLDLGHTDIAHVPGPPDWSEARARESEWRAVMAEAGLPTREPLARGWNSEVGYDRRTPARPGGSPHGGLRRQRRTCARPDPRLPRGGTVGSRGRLDRGFRRHPDRQVLHSPPHHRAPGLPPTGSPGRIHPGQGDRRRAFGQADLSPGASHRPRVDRGTPQLISNRDLTTTTRVSSSMAPWTPSSPSSMTARWL